LFNARSHALRGNVQGTIRVRIVVTRSVPRFLPLVEMTQQADVHFARSSSDDALDLLFIPCSPHKSENARRQNDTHLFCRSPPAGLPSPHPKKWCLKIRYLRPHPECISGEGVTFVSIHTHRQLINPTNSIMPAYCGGHVCIRFQRPVQRRHKRHIVVRQTCL